jgi:hypothetical protein
MNLSKNDKFLSEIKEFKTKISKIQNDTVKAKADQLMMEIIREVADIDRRHQEMIYGSSLSSSVSEKRDHLISLRRQMTSLLKDYESVNFK